MPPPVTDTQLAARLNPTPATLNLPAGGELYRLSSNIDPTGSSGIHYRNADGSVSSFSPGDLAIQEAGGSDAFWATHMNQQNAAHIAGVALLKSKYGIDYNSIKEQNYNDAGTLSSGKPLDINTLQGLISGYNAPAAGSGDKTVNTTPNAISPTVKPGVQPATVGSEIPTHLPGGTATTLYDYFASKGQTLPSVSDRSSTFQQLGLGSAADYKGTAQQNEDMLSAMQRKDYATTTIGSPTSSASAGMNSTPAGTSLSTALAGGDAATTIANYKTFLSTQLGVASANVTSSENALNSFFSTEKDPTSILNDAIDSAGVTESRGILATLDKTIADQSATLAKLPDDIRTTLADVGVSQAQLERLVTAETKAPDAALKDLMTERAALSGEIDKAMTFAKQFADTKIAGQAAKLAALEWQVTSAKGDYNTLSADAKAVITQAVSDKKSIMTTALTAAKNGASADVVDAILAAGSGAEALQIAGPTMVTPKKTAASGTAAGAPVTSGNIVMSQGDITAGQNALKASASQGAEADNKYADPALYLSMYKHWIGAGGKEADFFKNYPYTTYVNPSNTWLTQSMSDFNKQSSGSSGGGGAQTP